MTSARTRLAKRTWWILVPGVVVGLSACSSSPEGEVTPFDDTVIRGILDDALAMGISDEQRFVIEVALSEGRGLTFQEYRTAKNVTIDCLRDLGLDVPFIRELPRAGWTEVVFAYGGLPDAEMATLGPSIDACMVEHSTWIEYAYQASDPEAATAVMNSYLTPMLECLRTKGKVLPEGSTIEDAMQADWASEGGSDPDDSCIVETGLVNVL